MRKFCFQNEEVILDDGIIFGRGAFETILIMDNPIFLDEHINRLNKAIKVLEIGEEIHKASITSKIKEFNIKNCAFKVLVTQKNIILLKRDLTYKEEAYNKGFRLKISKVIRNSTSLLTYVKSINYIENILENQKCKEEGYNEVIFFNENNRLTEGSTSNIFIIKSNKIYTPKIQCGLLDGIIRNYVIKNTNCIEKEIDFNELLNADEIFITNSLIGIMNVSSIENKEFNNNKITNIIREKYINEINKLGR